MLCLYQPFTSVSCFLDLVFKVFKLYTDCTPRDDIMKASPKYEETYHYNLFKNNHSYSKSKHPLRMMVIITECIYCTI